MRPSPPFADRLTVTSGSPEETRRFAARLAGVARPGDLLALHGDLGAGKTEFAKGFAQGLGVTATVASPSFVLMAEHAGRLPFFHLDLYRLPSAVDALAGGLLDERQAAGVTVVEWPERFGPAIPADRLDVRIDGAGETTRTIEIAPSGPSHGHYLDAIR